MRIKAKIPHLTLGLVSAVTFVCAAHAANPLEQIVNQQVNQQAERYTQRSNDRVEDNNAHNERRDDHDRRERRDRHDRHGRNDDNRNNGGNASCRDESSLRSVQGNVHTTMKFVNRTNKEIRSYWLDYSGRRVFYKAIAPNGNYTQPTFQTHPWVITDQRDNCINIVVSNRPSDVVEIR